MNTVIRRVKSYANCKPTMYCRFRHWGRNACIIIGVNQTLPLVYIQYVVFVLYGGNNG